MWPVQLCIQLVQHLMWVSQHWVCVLHCWSISRFVLCRVLDAFCEIHWEHGSCKCSSHCSASRGPLLQKRSHTKSVCRPMPWTRRLFLRDAYQFCFKSFGYNPFSGLLDAACEYAWVQGAWDLRTMMILLTQETNFCTTRNTGSLCAHAWFVKYLREM